MKDWCLWLGSQESGLSEGGRGMGFPAMIPQRTLANPLHWFLSAPGFLLTTFPSRLNPRLAFRTAAVRARESPSPDFSSPVLTRTPITSNKCKSRAKLGTGCKNYRHRFVGGKKRRGGLSLKPCDNAPFERGGPGLLSAVVPAPCAGVCDGKSAKAIRTFVLGH